jgi:hypothetical protein
VSATVAASHQRHQLAIDSEVPSARKRVPAMRISLLKSIGRPRSRGIAFSLILLGLLGATAASATSYGSLAWTLGTVTAIDWNVSDVNLGDVFTSDVNGTVTGLGIYAGNNATYTNPETVALYSATGTLLTSTTVTDTDPQSYGYYWASTSPVTLTAGAVYTVVDFTNGNGWGYGTVSDKWATFDYDDYVYTDTLPGGEC